jgi:16S rRNA (guanine527-N7)-methyltransferase
MTSIERDLEREIRTLLVPTAAAAWGITLDEQQREQFLRYAVELLGWNEHVNLTRITTARDIVVRHFLDSLACTQAWQEPPRTLADVGTGAGFPGIPLKIIWPHLHLTLSDSIGKKTLFLEHVRRNLALDHVEIVTMRAEEHGHDPAHRERYDAVVARAVAALPVLSEYCLPLLRVGGRFVAPKGADGAAEARAAERALGHLGGTLVDVLPVVLPGVEPRTLVVIDKKARTPRGFPRPPGMPAKRPL